MTTKSKAAAQDAGYRVLSPADLSAAHGLRAFALDVLNGLSETPKRLSSRWIYDDEGSRLFSRICELDEYYPTRTEAEILRNHTEEILKRAGTAKLDIVDLGAGDGRKTNIMLEAARKQVTDVRYVPIDISEASMSSLVTNTRAKFSDVKVAGIVAEYFDGLHWLSQSNDRRNLVLFLGSNIGNFNKVQARVFLRQLWEALNDGDQVLIGFDLKKDIELLLAAYNDRQGVTAAFNKNLLKRVNRELGGDFDLAAYRHFATYDVFSGAMESYIVSLKRQTVTIKELRSSFDFQEWEPLHTEYSYKYLQSDIDGLAANTGFRILDQYYDNNGWFTDSLWQVEKPTL
ncbi:MAG: L-histidine N(alpha)-methyltransferase [Planctomycetes bacterium]|nr:L-histidine N(alpha)-methyltransferase [Planctomycetota bacterium]